MEENSRSQAIKWALKTSVPVFMGYIPLGVVFGFLFVQAGAEWWLAPLSSIMIYGGAVQYMMIPVLAEGLPISAIAFATFVVNLRHVFYGLSLIDTVPKKGPAKWFLSFLLTDETYSLLTTLPKSVPLSNRLFLAFFNYLWWILGSLIGALLGLGIKVNLGGFDFVLTSLFAMLLCEQWRQRDSSWPVWIALASYGAARLISVEHCLALAIAFSSIGALLLMLPRRKMKEKIYE
ncbi:AzlC family ABC transporter permease [Turicimonas muris]|uniref:AzlC family ABC transporter permease n=2 Tax=Turicimonas muris TaxID=1796652 RepID=UPI002494FCDF|nr:AzlC family ABC transporter permease [Turicimonas muris]